MIEVSGERSEKLFITEEEVAYLEKNCLSEPGDLKSRE